MKTDGFSRCVICSRTARLIQSAKDNVQVAFAQTVYEAPLEPVRTARLNLETARNRSREDPDKLFCEIDGMDSAKTVLLKK
jgi:hypothetical protein